MKKLIVLLVLAFPAVAFAAEPTVNASDVDLLTKLWKAGSFFQVGGLFLFAGLVVAAKLDKGRAFYWAGGATALGLVIEAIRTGNTPTLAMVVTAVGTFVALAMKGPEKPAKSEPATEAAK